MFARPATDPGQAYQRPPVTAAGISSPPQLTSPRVLQIPIYSWYASQYKMALYKRMCIYRGQIIGPCLWRGSEEQNYQPSCWVEFLLFAIGGSGSSVSLLGSNIPGEEERRGGPLLTWRGAQQSQPRSQ